jgi:hypothetical protein
MRGRKSDSGPSTALRAAAAALVLLSCAGGAAAQQTFGYVLDVRGEWRLNGGGRLSKGSSLPVGGTVTAADPGDGGGYIVVADRGGNIFDRRSCGNAGECARPIRLPATAGSGQSYFTRVMGAAMRLMAGQPGRYVAFISRGGGGDLQEAVLRLDAQKLDVSPVFRNMPGDRYFVRFESLGRGARAGARPLEMEFEWDAERPAPLGAKDLGPGLYRVTVRDVSLLAPEGGEPSGNEAWVLVTTARGYRKAAPSFEAALNVTRQWGDQVRQTSVRQFLRATLEFITTQGLQ